MIGQINRFFKETITPAINTKVAGALRDVGAQDSNNHGVAAYNLLINTDAIVTVQTFAGDTNANGAPQIANPTNAAAWAAIYDATSAPITINPGTPQTISVPITAQINTFVVTFGATAPAALRIRSSFTAA